MRTTNIAPLSCLLLATLGLPACGDSSAGDTGDSSVETGTGTGGTGEAPTGTDSPVTTGTSSEAPTSTSTDGTGDTENTDDTGNTDDTDDTNDTGSTDDTEDTGIELGDPIVVDPGDLEKWVWAPIDGMRCADGSSSGVMVNFTAQSSDVMIYFQGGGACWNALTCNTMGQALAPWGTDPYAAWAADGGPLYGGIFNRGDAANPLRAYNYVFVPYCTGDGHIGDKVADYGTHHVGYANATAAVARIVPSFLDAAKVVVAGFSAGGIGATGNYHQIARAFESVGVSSLLLINDSGPFLRPPLLSMGTQNMLRDAWGGDKTIDTWCAGCATEGLHAIYREQAALHPGVRSALICAYNDSVVRLLYTALFSPVELGALELGLRELAKWREEAEVGPSLLREFYYFSDRHGALELPFDQTPGLLEFLTAQIEGSPDWASVIP